LLSLQAPVDQQQQQQPQIQLLTSRALAIPSVTQAAPTGLVHQRGIGTTLPVASGVALAHPSIAHQKLQSGASLSTASSSVSTSNAMVCARSFVRSDDRVYFSAEKCALSP